MYQILRFLEHTEPSDRTRISTALHAMAERLRRRGLCILISDLFDDADEVIRGLKHFRHRQHEVIVFHVLDDLERTFDFRDEARFIDMETRQEIRSQPWFVKKDYKARVESWMRDSPTSAASTTSTTCDDDVDAVRPGVAGLPQQAEHAGMRRIGNGQTAASRAEETA
jgi:hypothetical protein